MKAKIFSFVKMSESSMIASVRIARFLSEILKLPVCWDTTIADEPLDILVIINGAYAFSGAPLLESLGTAVESAAYVIWVQNDYTIIPPKDTGNAESPFRKAFRIRRQTGMSPPNFWTTVAPMSNPGVTKSGHRVGEHSRYINWNCLTTDLQQEWEPFERRPSGESLVYYGSFRKDRTEYFDRYFVNPVVKTTISSPSKKFECYPLCNRVGKCEVYKFLSQFGLGLYLEDKKSHIEFHSPANRFYEMMSSGLPIVFQPESTKMMREAGYDIADFIVKTSKDIARMLEKKTEIWEQQSDWLPPIIDDRKRLPEIVLDHWRSIVYGVA